MHVLQRVNWIKVLSSSVFTVFRVCNIFYKNKALTDICGLLDEFYDLDNLHYIYGKLAVGDTSDENVEEIYKNMDAILKTYFYVSDEQVQAIRTADSTQIQLIIEESVKNKYE